MFHIQVEVGANGNLHLENEGMAGWGSTCTIYPVDSG